MSRRTPNRCRYYARGSVFELEWSGKDLPRKKTSKKRKKLKRAQLLAQKEFERIVEDTDMHFIDYPVGKIVERNNGKVDAYWGGYDGDFDVDIKQSDTRIKKTRTVQFTETIKINVNANNPKKLIKGVDAVLKYLRIFETVIVNEIIITNNLNSILVRYAFADFSNNPESPTLDLETVAKKLNQWLLACGVDYEIEDKTGLAIIKNPMPIIDEQNIPKINPMGFAHGMSDIEEQISQDDYISMLDRVEESLL